MDPAFQSRIQMALGYEEFVPSQREKIWKSLLSAVLVDLTDVDRVVIEKALPKWSEYNLNGREIRNTLTLAGLLALDDLSSEGKVKKKHIENALGEALQFQDFFEDAKKNYTNKNRVWKPFAPSQNTIHR